MIKNLIVGASIAVMALTAPITSALAQAACAPRNDIVKLLTEQYKEVPQVGGLNQGGDLFEFWASSRTGTWTITISNAQGMTCLVAAGNAFDDLRGNPL